MKIIAVHLRVLIVIFLLNIVNLFARFYLERFRETQDKLKRKFNNGCCSVYTGDFKPECLCRCAY